MRKSSGTEVTILNNIIHWFYVHENLLAVIVTLGVGLLIFCSLECTSCFGCDRQDEFRRRHL